MKKVLVRSGSGYVEQDWPEGHAVKIGDKVRETLDGHVHTIVRIDHLGFYTDRVKSVAHNAVDLDQLGRTWLPIISK